MEDLGEDGSHNAILFCGRLHRYFDRGTGFASTPADRVLVEAIEKAVTDIAKFDAGASYFILFQMESDFQGDIDEWFVIAITDANFGRYNISAEDLRKAMTSQPKVKTALICIGEGAEATW